MRWLALAALSLAVAGSVVGGIAWWSRRPPPPPPGITYETSDDGVRLARIDVEALATWCGDRGLPRPPGVREVEPIFAEDLASGLMLAATQPDAAVFGRIGMISESVESHEAAEAWFILAAEAEPLDHRWPYYLGCIHQVTGRNDTAAAHFERSREINPDYPVTWARLAQLDLEAGRLDAAEARFRRYSDLVAGDWLGAVGLGRVALRRGDAEAALAYLEEALRRGGQDDFQTNHQIGRVHAGLGNRDEAERFFERAQELPQGGWYRMRDPLDRALHDIVETVSVLESRFGRLRTSERHSELIAIAEEILRRRSRDVTMMGNLASLYRKTGRYVDAHTILDRGIAAGGDALRLHCLRAEVYLAENDFPRCVEAADRALALDAESGRAHGLRARALLMLERPVEAETHMRRSLELLPDDAENRLVLGETLLRRGDLEGAEHAYRQVLTEVPGNALAQSRLESIAASRTGE